MFGSTKRLVRAIDWCQDARPAVSSRTPCPLGRVEFRGARIMPSPARDAIRADDVRGSAAFECSEPCLSDEDGGFVSMLVADPNGLVVGDYAVENLRPIPPGFARADGPIHREPAQVIVPIGLAPASLHPAQHETEWASGIDDGPGRVVVPVSLRTIEMLLGLTDAGPASVDYPCRSFYLYMCTIRSPQTREAARSPGPEVVVFHARQVAARCHPIINGLVVRERRAAHRTARPDPHICQSAALSSASGVSTRRMTCTCWTSSSSRSMIAARPSAKK